MGQVGWARARVSEAIRVVSSLERLQARSPCLAPCQAGCVYPDDCVARPAHRNAMSAQDKLAVLAVAAGIDSAAIGAVVEAAPARSHVRGRTAHNPGHALRAARASASAAVDTAKLQAAELAVRASATRSLALLPARTHCAGPALLGRPSRFKHCARRCPASPLPQRRTPPARQPQSSRCVPPPDAVWRCFLRARTARASSACQTITLHALCAQVPGKSAAAAPDATSAPAAELAVRASARRSLALLPARTHCAGQLCLPELHATRNCVRRCPASPLPQRRTPPARQPQSSRCVPPPDAVWRCFLRARTARAQLCLAELHATRTVRAGGRQVRCRSAGRHHCASRRARGACLRQTQSGVASCAHALRGPSSAWQSFTLHALCAQVAGKFAAAAPDATSAPAADLAVRATLAIARPWQPSVGTHALHEPLSA